MDGTNTKPHAALVSSPGMGHLIPTLELGHRLVTHHGLKVTVFVITTDASTTESELHRQPTYRDILNIVLLPTVDIASINCKSRAILSQTVLVVQRSLPLLQLAILTMKEKPAALIVDLFSTEAFGIADELKMLKYVFWTANAWFLAYIINIPYINEREEDEHVRLHKPLSVPGCAPVLFDDTTLIFQEREDEIMHSGYVKLAHAMAKANGILVNTWESLEPDTLRALRDPEIFGKFVSASIYTIGPIVRPAQPIEPQGSIKKVLEWLDLQPSKSVLYVSFGSGGTLSGAQLAELAFGLEQSRHRFIWVVRPPREDNTLGTYFKAGNKADGLPDYLPEGFLARTSEVGRVVPSWAPQREILSHGSIGGFLTHCGWNSSLESIVEGVPMICWPLYAEQKMNATMLSDQLGAAVRTSRESLSKGLIGRAEIEGMMRTIMETDADEGKAIRAKVQGMQSSARATIAEGGSSHTMLSSIAKECKIGS